MCPICIQMTNNSITITVAFILVFSLSTVSLATEEKENNFFFWKTFKNSMNDI